MGRAMDFGAAETDFKMAQGNCGGVLRLEWKIMVGMEVEIALNTGMKRRSRVRDVTSVFFFQVHFEQEPNISGFMPG
jgi:hypothetical protein